MSRPHGLPLTRRIRRGKGVRHVKRTIGHIALKSRTFWMQDLATGWPMIRANLPTFFVIPVLMIGVVRVVVNRSYTGVLVASVARPSGP